MSSKTRKSRRRRPNEFQAPTPSRHRLHWMLRDEESLPAGFADRTRAGADEPESSPGDRAQQIVADRLYQQTPLARMRQRHKSQRRILRRYDQSAQQLETYRPSTEQFLAEVLSRGFDFAGFEGREDLLPRR